MRDLLFSEVFAPYGFAGSFFFKYFCTTMYGDAKKIHLIEQILKTENDSLLNQVEAILSSSAGNLRRSFKEFAGMMTDKEAAELEKIIEEGCEQIHPDDWK